MLKTNSEPTILLNTNDTFNSSFIRSLLNSNHFTNDYMSIISDTKLSANYLGNSKRCP